MDAPSKIICPACRATVLAASHFCPNCGKPLRDKLPAVSLSGQAIVCAVSLFLPPFGLWYAWKYLKQPDVKSKNIGIAALILTAISLIVTVWLVRGLVDLFNQALNSANDFYGY